MATPPGSLRAQERGMGARQRGSRIGAPSQARTGARSPEVPRAARDTLPGSAAGCGRWGPDPAAEPPGPRRPGTSLRRRAVWAQRGEASGIRRRDPGFAEVPGLQRLRRSRLLRTINPEPMSDRESATRLPRSHGVTRLFRFRWRGRAAAPDSASPGATHRSGEAIRQRPAYARTSVAPNWP